MICTYFKKLSSFLKICCFVPCVVLLYTVVLMLKKTTQQTYSSFNDEVLFQIEKIIITLTIIPSGTIVFVMRKLHINEVKGLGVGAWKYLVFVSRVEHRCLSKHPWKHVVPFPAQICQSVPLPCLTVIVIRENWKQLPISSCLEKTQIQVHELNQYVCITSSMKFKSIGSHKLYA